MYFLVLGEKKAGCFALALSLLLCGHWCSVSLWPRGALGCLQCVAVALTGHTNLLSILKDM